MLGFLFAAFTAFFESLKDVFSKKSLKNLDEYVVAWALHFFVLIFVAPLLLVIGIPPIGNRFWEALIITGLLDALVAIIYMRALKASDLSLTIPMIAFTPLFLLITAPLIVGEFPSALGVAGILLIVFGAYFMKISERHEGLAAPFRALLKETGPRLMLIAAFIWSITSSFDKVGVLNSSPIFWIVAVDAVISLFLFPIAFFKSKEQMLEVPKKLRALVPIGFLSAIAMVFQMIAIKLTLVAYVISIKRAGIIFGVLFGHFIFKEKGAKERLIGAAIMVLGVVLIALS